MTTAEKWKHRAALKFDLLVKHGRKHVSGEELNIAAGLPHDAVWREENFA